ncbi:MAG: mobile mystery protein A [Comamonadaceae bacterium]|uniref:mobile mystery protein A n=1 Tax=Candidatus Skiveiella danica TaxID=3386177 RepID=UPI00390B4131|nr:mobile mystery protein A [Comamonadaceae bacterium]
MTDTKTRLKRLQLEDVLRPYPTSEGAAVPRGGWLRAIREALGMTQAQLGGRASISRQSVQDFEHAEADRRITLESLDKLARAMGCRLVYALVPENGSVDALRERRALALAEVLLQPTDHSMKLEAQGVTAPERERQRRLLADTLLNGSPRKLWQ